MRTLLALTLAALPCPLIAQEICIAPRPSIMPDCTVGAWYGGSDISEKLAAVLANAPGAVAQIREDTGQNLFIRIFNDGFYVTGRLTANVILKLDEDADANITYDFVTTPTLGWMGIREDNEMEYFCAHEGSGDGILTVTSGGHSNSMMTSTLPETGYKPDIQVQCEGDTMRMLVDLPAPVHTVTYTLQRIPAARLPDYVQELYEDRMEE